MPVSWKFSQQTRPISLPISVTLSYTKWFVWTRRWLHLTFFTGKTSASAQEQPSKERSVRVLSLLISLELSSLPICSPLKFYWIFPLDFEIYGKPHFLSQPAYRQAVLSEPALGFVKQLNYKIEIDGENSIYILASSKFFLPAIHPSCCPHAKNSLLGS